MNMVVMNKALADFCEGFVHFYIVCYNENMWFYREALACFLLFLLACNKI